MRATAPERPGALSLDGPTEGVEFGFDRFRYGFGEPIAEALEGEHVCRGTNLVFQILEVRGPQLSVDVSLGNPDGDCSVQVSLRRPGSPV